MRKRVLLLATVAALLSACATRAPIQYRLDCLAIEDFEGCGKVYESESACEAVRHEMIREVSARDRGTCLRV